MSDLTFSQMQNMDTESLLRIRDDLEKEFTEIPSVSDIRKASTDPGFLRQSEITGKLGDLAAIVGPRGAIDLDGNVVPEARREAAAQEYRTAWTK
jgi:hypothetical protein